VCHAFDRQAWFAEIQQKVELQADHAPRQIIQPVAICVFCVHLLLASALKLFLRDAAGKWLWKC
jgi:hypothetical protein